MLDDRSDKIKYFNRNQENKTGKFLKTDFRSAAEVTAHVKDIRINKNQTNRKTDLKQRAPLRPFCDALNLDSAAGTGCDFKK